MRYVTKTWQTVQAAEYKVWMFYVIPLLVAINGNTRTAPNL